MAAAQPTWHVEEVSTGPDTSYDDPVSSWAHEGLAQVQRESYLHANGHHDHAAPLPVWVGLLQPQPHETRVVRVAVRDRDAGEAPTADDVLGAAVVFIPMQEDARTAGVMLLVRPTARGTGVGSALLAAADAVVREHGRTVMVANGLAEPASEADPAGLLTPAKGTGFVSRDGASARFALRHGYALEQVGRPSTLHLPITPARLAELEADVAHPRAGDYVLHTWWDAVPQRWLDDVATLFARMSTDAPHGGLDLDESVWDADRVRDWIGEKRRARQNVVITAAEHVPSGTLVAFTVLQLPDFDGVPFAFQLDTLVLREHRGRRLGLRVKLANLAAATMRRPWLERVHTDNADENVSMRAINTAMGFAVAGSVGLWQKTLEPASDR
jgi:GNAT superfamily N-acetyltransferase